MARLVLAIALGGIVLKGLIGALESRMVFFPYKGEDRNPASLGIKYQAIELSTSDGERLIAWQLEPENPIADVVYFHGNGGNLSVWLPALASLYARRLRVLAVDYRGYGLSSGTPSEDGVYLDAEAAVRYAIEHRSKNTPRPLVFWGRSLGGPIAASATRTFIPDGLVIESSFPEKAAVVRGHVLLRTLNLLASYRFPTAEMLRDFRNPVLVMHGDRDSVVPFELGRELFERLSGPKRFSVIQGADHNDWFDATNQAYWTAVLDFIKSLRTGGAGGYT